MGGGITQGEPLSHRCLVENFASVVDAGQVFEDGAVRQRNVPRHDKVARKGCGQDGFIGRVCTRGDDDSQALGDIGEDFSRDEAQFYPLSRRELPALAP